MSDPSRTYSIQLRVRRLTIEDAYVAVPVTDAVVDRAPDGTGRLNASRLAAQALRISENPRVQWQVEAARTRVHPMQGPMPEGREKFDAFDAFDACGHPGQS